MALCAFIKPDGYRCRAQAMKGYQWCYVHNPNLAEERKRNNSRGGKLGGRGRSGSPSGELTGVKDQLQELTDLVLSGELDRADAAVCGQLLNVKLRALEQERRWREIEVLQSRLEALESVLKARDKAG